MSKRQCLFLIAIYALILSGINFFTGFGEDPDSARLLYAAQETAQKGRMVPSRSWGFPLYEGLIYGLLNSFGFETATFAAKCCSLLFIIGSAFALYRTLTFLKLSNTHSFWLVVAYASNPLVIIASNSILETALFLFLMLSLLNLVQRFLAKQTKVLLFYLRYGILFGFLNLARPDASVFFPVLFLLLMIRRRLHIRGLLLSGALTLLLGVLPYFLLGYPIFKVLPGTPINKLLFGAKNFVLLFGIPLLLALLTGIGYLIVRHRKTCPEKPGRHVPEMDTFRQYLLLTTLFVIVRVMIFPDEVEYGLYLWPVFIVLCAGAILDWEIRSRRMMPPSFFLGLIALTLLPNLVQFHLFREKDFTYVISPGISAGVFYQERNLRQFQQHAFLHIEDILLKASAGIRKKEVRYEYQPAKKDCSNCLQLYPMRDVLRLKELNAHGHGHNHLVFTPRFNLSRGWRNLIRFEPLPLLTTENVVLVNQQGP